VSDSPTILTPYMTRTINTNDESIALDLMNYLKVKYPEMIDEQGEVVFSLMLAWYIEHRRHMLDYKSLGRILQNITNIHARGGDALRTGQSFTKIAIDEVHKQQLADDDFKRHI
jgi:hypothetical protein